MQFNVSLQYLFDNRLYLMDGSQNLFNDQQKIHSFEIKYLSFKNDILVDFSSFVCGQSIDICMYSGILLQVQKCLFLLK